MRPAPAGHNVGKGEKEKTPKQPRESSLDMTDDVMCQDIKLFKYYSAKKKGQMLFFKAEFVEGSKTLKLEDFF